jgi:hypothetical protein
MDLLVNYGIKASSLAPAIPAYELLYDSNVSATLPLTQIDITGLSIGKNDELRMVYTFVGESTNSTAYDLRVNDITSNYTMQLLQGAGTSIAAGRSTSANIVNARSNRRVAGFADIKLSENSRFVVQSQFVEYIGSESSNVRNNNRNIVNTDTVTSITKLSVVASATNGIASGSRIRLYKVNTGAA